VTFDKNSPRGCKLFGFKSPQIPAVLVKKETGADCEEFERNAQKGSEDAKKLNFNDSKYWD